MNIVTDIEAWQKIQGELAGKTLGFVPTMGHLHAGHLSLCARAKAENERVLASIFVNPTQFNQPKDFELYPRTIENDCDLLAKAEVDYLFLPNNALMYRDQFEVQIQETVISKVLEGAFRPGHFSGMLTVVLKLLNIVQPKHAYFGLKDYQQFLLIKKLKEALFLPVEIVGCETIRSHDGLALSSRNSRLNPEQKQRAIFFAQTLQNPALKAEEVFTHLQAEGFKVDYVEDHWGRRLAAVWIDEVRLIDNIPMP